MALPEGAQARVKSLCHPFVSSMDISSSSLVIAGAISHLIAEPPAIGTVQKLGLGEPSETQTHTLLPSGCHTAEPGCSLCCPKNSARTWRGGLPSICTT